MARYTEAINQKWRKCRKILKTSITCENTEECLLPDRKNNYENQGGRLPWLSSHDAGSPQPCFSHFEKALKMTKIWINSFDFMWMMWKDVIMVRNPFQGVNDDIIDQTSCDLLKIPHSVGRARNDYDHFTGNQSLRKIYYHLEKLQWCFSDVGEAISSRPRVGIFLTAHQKELCQELEGVDFYSYVVE